MRLCTGGGRMQRSVRCGARAGTGGAAVMHAGSVCLPSPLAVCCSGYARTADSFDVLRIVDALARARVPHKVPWQPSVRARTRPDARTTACRRAGAGAGAGRSGDLRSPRATSPPRRAASGPGRRQAAAPRRRWLPAEKVGNARVRARTAISRPCARRERCERPCGRARRQHGARPPGPPAASAARCRPRAESRSARAPGPSTTSCSEWSAQSPPAAPQAP